MRIGIYGGTFNPIHRGHLTAAQAAMDVLGLDRLLLIPASVPPHKALPQGSAEPADRLEMTALACAQLAPGPGSGHRAAPHRPQLYGGYPAAAAADVSGR